MSYCKLGFLILCIFMPACVQVPVPTELGWSTLTSPYAIVAVDGVSQSGVFELSLKPGEHRIIVLYPTLQKNYRCEFFWAVQPSYHYEIVAHSDVHPLTLYRWQKRNVFWALRTEALHPLVCNE